MGFGVVGHDEGPVDQVGIEMPLEECRDEFVAENVCFGSDALVGPLELGLVRVCGHGQPDPRPVQERDQLEKGRRGAVHKRLQPRPEHPAVAVRRHRRLVHIKHTNTNTPVPY